MNIVTIDFDIIMGPSIGVYNNAVNEDFKVDSIIEDYPFLSEDIRNYIAENLDIEKVISKIELNYSLSYSQGDGISFKCDFDLEKWLKKYDFQDFKKRVMLLKKHKQNLENYNRN